MAKISEEEYQKITREYEIAFAEYLKYLDQFITSTVDGAITNRATKIVTSEEVDKIHAMRLRVDKLQDKWLDALKN